MSVIQPTKTAHLLNEALNAVGIETKLEHCGMNINTYTFISKGKIYVEIDGPQHYISPKQIVTDFLRDHYSDDDGFHTMRISNEVVEKQAIKIARAIKKILNF